MYDISPPMRSQTALLAFVLLVAHLPARADKPKPPYEPECHPIEGICVDNSMPDWIHEEVRKDLERYGSIQLNAPKDSLFALVFGGTDGKAVLKYLQQRVRYISIYESGHRSGVYASNSASRFMNFYALHGLGLAIPEMDPTILPFQRGLVRMDQPSEGYMNVGTAYKGSTKVNESIGRMDTLVHEARHSDCAEFPSLDDVKLTLAGKTSSARGRQCYHRHVDCADGLEAGCDDEPFGAYGVGYVFSRAIVDWSKASEKQKEQAAASYRLDRERISKDAFKILQTAWDGSKSERMVARQYVNMVGLREWTAPKSTGAGSEQQLGMVPESPPPHP